MTSLTADSIAADGRASWVSACVSCQLFSGQAPSFSLGPVVSVKDWPVVCVIDHPS